MKPLMEDVLERASHALRLPNSAIRVLNMSSQEKTDADELVNVIQTDPIFAAYLLRLVNSSTYSRGGTVTSIERAVRVLGFQEVGLMAVVLASSKNLSKIETELLSSTSFWNHSLTTAILARATARKLKIKDNGLFAAALLHDFALPVQIGLCTESMREALDISMYAEDVSLTAAEWQQLGFDHTVLGSALFELWGLPEVIIEAARYHHNPSECTQFRKQVALIAWANVVEHLGTDADEEDYLEHARLFTEISEIIPIGAPEDDTLLIEAQAEAADMIALF